MIYIVTAILLANFALLGLQLYEKHSNIKKLEKASETMSQDCFITDCKAQEDGLFIPWTVLKERKAILWEKVMLTKDTSPEISHAWNGRFFEIANMLRFKDKASSESSSTSTDKSDNKIE